MATGVEDQAEAMLRGQAEIWKLMVAHVHSMALKCVVELQIPDIIHSHGGAITLSELAARIGSPTPDVDLLGRIMRLLVCKNVFAATTRKSEEDGGETTLYSLTPSSRWLLNTGSHLTLAPMVLLEGHAWLVSPFQLLGRCVKEGGGGMAFEMTHGRGLWDMSAEDPSFNRMFNDGMACTAKITVKAILEVYKEGFDGVGTLTDVGGGAGVVLQEIVKCHPHIKGINFDLPHVIATAAHCEGVSNVEGDMFESVPAADAIFMKRILHDWDDETCVKILKNCKKAIPEKIGKVIIVEVVLESDRNDLFNEAGIVFDLVMFGHTMNGRERTETEWKKLLKEGGFPRYNIVKIPALFSIIEAFPV